MQETPPRPSRVVSAQGNCIGSAIQDRDSEVLQCRVDSERQRRTLSVPESCTVLDAGRDVPGGAASVWNHGRAITHRLHGAKVTKSIRIGGTVAQGQASIALCVGGDVAGSGGPTCLT